MFAFPLQWQRWAAQKRPYGRKSQKYLWSGPLRKILADLPETISRKLPKKWTAAIAPGEGMSTGQSQEADFFQGITFAIFQIWIMNVKFIFQFNWKLKRAKKWALFPILNQWKKERKGRGWWDLSPLCWVWVRSGASSQERSQGGPALGLSLALAYRPRTAGWGDSAAREPEALPQKGARRQLCTSACQANRGNGQVNSDCGLSG